ncbi:MAG: RNA methyltransferase [Nitrospirota bacterium]
MTRNAPPFPNLPSTKAALIRDLLRQKKTRDAERAFVLEGAKPILELLRANFPSLLAVVATPTYLEKSDPALQRALEQGSTPVYTCREMVFEKLSDVSTSPGILAVLKQPEWDQETIFKRPRLFGIYGEGLQDPANVGAIIRTAVAFGVDGLWLSSESADVFNPKVVRASAGAVMNLPVFTMENAAGFRKQGCALLAADPSGKHSRPVHEIDTIPARSIIALGNESRGLSEATLKQATLRFHIPTSWTMESLNVAASAAIAVFHFSALPREGK